MCPKCPKKQGIVKIGSFIRRSDRKRIQRYRCRQCLTSFSDQTNRVDFRHRKRHLNQAIFRLLAKGMSQRGIAEVLGTRPETVARRVERFGRVAKDNLDQYRCSRKPATTILIDEMESFEHTKCKPLTIPICVEEKTRKILSLKVGRIAAKGHLAAISRKKYGFRRCERKRVLNTVLAEVVPCSTNNVLVKSDESHHYPSVIRKWLPGATHKTYKGRRGCVVGQGELKSGGFDPLFYLNHTYAMIRDNLKRLTRRTWCTTKRPDRLEKLLYLYAWLHNMKLDGIKIHNIMIGP